MTFLLFYNFEAGSHIINCKSDGFHALPHLLHLTSVLLHQAYNESAALLSIVRVIIHVVQLYDKLRVRPEGVWDEKHVDQWR